MAVTKRDNLIDVQTLSDYLSVKLCDAIKLTPVVMVDQTLVGRAGSKLELPKYEYVQMADIVGENEEAVPVALSSTSEEVEIKKAVKAIEVTDEAKLGAYGDIIDEIGKQLLVAMADRIEQDLMETLKTATKKVQVAEFGKDAIADAIAEGFGEDDVDGETFLFINPKNFAVLRKDESFIHVDNGIVTGERGMVHGVRIVCTNRMAENQCVLMKSGALYLVLKRNVMVEHDRNVLSGVDCFVANEHYATNLRYDDKVVVINIG